MMRWSDKPVYLCCGYTDMRKSINGLMTLVQESFSLDPFADAIKAVFPKAIIQTCIIHQIRNSIKSLAPSIRRNS